MYRRYPKSKDFVRLIDTDAPTRKPIHHQSCYLCTRATRGYRRLWCEGNDRCLCSTCVNRGAVDVAVPMPKIRSECRRYK